MSKNDVRFFKDRYHNAVEKFRDTYSNNLTVTDDVITDCAILTEGNLDLVSFGDLNVYGCTVKAKNLNFHSNNSILHHAPSSEHYFYMYSANSIHITNKEGMAISAFGLSDPLDIKDPLQPSNKVVITHDGSLSIYTSNVNDFKTDVVLLLGQGDVKIFYSADERDL
jgi:hypothetical protein